MNSWTHRALVLSVVLNLAFLSGIGWKLASPEEPEQTSDAGTQDLLVLRETLSLTPQQWEFFEQDRQKAVQLVQERRQAMDELRSHIWVLLASDQPEQDRIDAALANVLAVQRQAQRVVVDHMIRLRASLDGRQKPLFDDFLARLRGCPMHQHSCPGSAPSLDGPDVNP